MANVAPSILSANFNNLVEEINSVNNAKYLHIDVMDGCFVPNITLGPVVIERLKDSIKDMIFDVHLMIVNPLKYASEFKKAGADIITFHYEAVNDPLDTILKIKELGVKVGISIKPNTDVKVLDDILEYVDLVLIMSVEPGFGGQKYIDSATDKIEYLKNKKDEFKYDYIIEVDGGINYETAKVAKDAGVDLLVVGSFLFKQENRNSVIKELEK